MSFTGIMIQIFLVGMILASWIIIIKKIRAKKIFKIISIILLLTSCVIVSGYLYFQRSTSFIFTKTTNLNEENIGEIKLYQSIDSTKFIKKYGKNFKKIENALFNYYKLSNGLEIATNKDRQIIRVVINIDSDNSIKTSKDIELGSSVDEAIKVYGKNYYKRMSDFGVPVIGYVDKKRKITLEFFNYHNRITEIRYDSTSMQ